MSRVAKDHMRLEWGIYMNVPSSLIGLRVFRVISCIVNFMSVVPNIQT